jgi:hypothetical protein
VDVAAPDVETQRGVLGGGGGGEGSKAMRRAVVRGVVSDWRPDGVGVA